MKETSQTIKHRPWNALLAMLLAGLLCCGLPACSRADADSDPVQTMADIGQSIGTSGAQLDEDDWDEAADRLVTAIERLPATLGNDQRELLTTTVSQMKMQAERYEPKAAKFVNVLNRYERNIYKLAGVLRSSYVMYGFADKYPITMQLRLQGHQVAGSYFYNEQGAAHSLPLAGTLRGEALTLSAPAGASAAAGRFEGRFEDGIYKGTFTDPQGRKMEFGVVEE